jgi:hypothetical protein
MAKTKKKKNGIYESSMDKKQVRLRSAVSDIKVLVFSPQQTICTDVYLFTWHQPGINFFNQSQNFCFCFKTAYRPTDGQEELIMLFILVMAETMTGD